MIAGWTTITLVLALLAGHAADGDPPTPRDQQRVAAALKGAPLHAPRAMKRTGQASAAHRATARPDALPPPAPTPVARTRPYDLVSTSFSISQHDVRAGLAARSRAPPPLV